MLFGKNLIKALSDQDKYKFPNIQKKISKNQCRGSVYEEKGLCLQRDNIETMSWILKNKLKTLSLIFFKFSIFKVNKTSGSVKPWKSNTF